VKVLFVHTGRAFLPELPAYIAELERRGHRADVIERTPVADDVGAYDLVFRFGGLLRSLPGSDVPEVHEYHSASTTRWPRLKNVAKSVLGVRPVGRVFLNEFVRAQFSFSDGVPSIYRDMGASSAFLHVRERTADVRYDVVYAGSISGRPGLLETILTLARSGLSVGVAGNATREVAARMAHEPGVEFVGLIAIDDVPEFVAMGRCGLNYCPDVYPLNRQTSTKVVEYLVAGVPIISNTYSWIDEHAGEHGYSYVPIDRVARRSDIDRLEGGTLSREAAERFTWGRVLEDSDFVAFLQRVGER
jgi:glycosyltransferase involved in cell wall biosynthesis